MAVVVVVMAHRKWQVVVVVAQEVVGGWFNSDSRGSVAASFMFLTAAVYYESHGV